MIGLTVICQSLAKGQQKTASFLTGKFEDVFANKHDLGGTFTIHAFESNALIDMTFENGFHEMVGTDGHDTFTYIPFTGDSNVIKNPNGQAIISYGRFPRNAHLFQQFIWLACVHDSALLTNLPMTKLSFYAGFTTNEISVQIFTNYSGSINSVKWYAPNSRLIGTNHLKAPAYPKGWLFAELDVTMTNLQKISGKVISIPSKITFNQFVMKPFDYKQTDFQRSNELRNPDDVLPIETALIGFTNAQLEQPLSSYIPKVVDKTARIIDRRMGNTVFQVRSGNWWDARELHAKREILIKPIRIAVIFFIIINTIFLIVFLLNRNSQKPK